MINQNSPSLRSGEGRGGDAPTHGQGEDFFRRLSEWEREQLAHLPADCFGTTQVCAALVEDDIDTEPYPPDFDTRKLLPIVFSDCGDEVVCHHPAEAVYWNPYNGVTQCHRCGEIIPHR